MLDILGPFNNKFVPLGATFSGCRQMANFLCLKQQIHFSYPTNDTQNGESLLWLIEQFFANAERNNNYFDHIVIDPQFDIAIIRQYFVKNYPKMTIDVAPPGEHNKIAEVERLNLSITDAMLRVFSNSAIPKGSWGYLLSYFLLFQAKQIQLFLHMKNGIIENLIFMSLLFYPFGVRFLHITLLTL
jgi:hypothetical protein